MTNFYNYVINRLYEDNLILVKFSRQSYYHSIYNNEHRVRRTSIERLN